MSGIPSPLQMRTDPYGSWNKSMFRTGIWRAKVVDVADPQNRGRVKVRILQLQEESSPQGSVFDASAAEAKTATAPPGGGVPDDRLQWAEPCFPWGGNIQPDENEGLRTEGFFAVPSVGSTVWVAFDQGFLGRPVWLGTWYGRDELPEEISDPANIRLLKTPGGHVLLFDDTPGQSRVLLATLSEGSSGAHSVRLIELDDQAQTVTIRNTSDSSADPRSLTLDAAAKKITLIEGLNRSLELDQTLQKVTLKQGPTQTLVQDGVTQSTILTDGANILTMNGAAGVITLTNGVVTLTIDAAGNTTLVGSGNVALNNTGLVTLGTGASLGVVLDSLIALFNAHTHTYVPGAGVPTETGTATGSGHTMVPGTHTSTTVRAKG